MKHCLAEANKPFVTCLAILIVMAAVLDVFVARSMSVTYDEPQSVAYGEQILHGHPERSDPLFNSKTPITALNAVPKFIAGVIHTSPGLVRVLSSIRVARLPSILATLLLDFLIGCWAYSLYGASAAIAVSVLAMFSPNLIAHGTLANNDGYFALGVVLALFCFREYLLRPTVRNAVVSSLTLALAQLTKPFALYLYLVAALFLTLATLSPVDPSRSSRRKDVITFAIVAAVSFVLIVNIGYCFDRPFTPLKSYQFESDSFHRLQHIPIIRSLPVPTPYPFLEGLDMLKHHDDSGLTYGKIYLLGELRDPLDPSFRPFKSYYFVAMFFKEPIAVQVLFCLGLIWILRNRNWREFITGEGVLLCAAAVLFVWFSFFRKSQLGIRNILPVIAVEVIVAGAAFAGLSAELRKTKIILVVLVSWACLSAISYYPDEIAYMNEWVIDRKQSYRILVDSNLDYGQEGDLVSEFLSRNPDVVLEPDAPVAGRILVGVNRLVGEWHGYEPMYWLLRRQPTGRVGYGHLLYVVSAQDIAAGMKSTDKLDQAERDGSQSSIKEAGRSFHAGRKRPISLSSSSQQCSTKSEIFALYLPFLFAILMADGNHPSGGAH